MMLKGRPTNADCQYAYVVIYLCGIKTRHGQRLLFPVQYGSSHYLSPCLLLVQQMEACSPREGEETKQT